MSTQALDTTTILHALATLEGEFLGTQCVWEPVNGGQTKIFGWLTACKDQLKRVAGLKSKASTDYRVLNAFLAEERFSIRLNPFEGIGVVSILDKLVEWLDGAAALTEIRGANGQTFPGFEIEANGAHVYRVVGQPGPLVEMKTKSADTLWLYLPDENISIYDGIDLVRMIAGVMASPRSTHDRYAGVRVPKIDFDITPDISFLIGAGVIDKDGLDWYITQAIQQFKFRMNEKGARARVATAISAKRGMSFEPVKLSINRPFYGWFTQPGFDMPIASFYADYNSWKEPAGSLEDL
jgi:hypothetical protein